MKVYESVSRIVNERFNIPALRRDYGATGDTVLEIQVFQDEDLHHPVFDRYFKLTDAGARIVDTASSNATAKCSIATIRRLLKGEVLRKMPSGKVYRFPYSPLDAMAEGYLQIDTDGYTQYYADLQLFDRIYREAFPVIREKLGALL